MQSVKNSPMGLLKSSAASPANVLLKTLLTDQTSGEIVFAKIVADLFAQLQLSLFSIHSSKAETQWPNLAYFPLPGSQ